ncbi:MAG: hypothetical protein JO001_04290, partial [Alphaproteobacteria bacterium]|nr:hypothetical protein [Alphaproteobacteria bacterium]
MATIVQSARPIPWWKEPTRDQWFAFVASWLGWTLDAFDFTIFLLIMVPISQEFNVPLTAVTAVSWGIGFMLSGITYGLLYNSIGWRGLLWIGVLPALAIVYVRFFVKEPPVWL